MRSTERGDRLWGHCSYFFLPRRWLVSWPLRMTPGIRKSVSFAVMAVLVFLGFHLFLYGIVSTGPHLYLSLGWLELHRYGDVWRIEHFHFVGLLAVLLISVLLTCLLSKSVRR